MKITKNFGLNMPDEDDFVEIDKINENAEKIDEELAKKADASGGDISETVITTVKASQAEYPVPAAGDSAKTVLGKVQKFFADIRNWMKGVCLLGQIVNNCVTDNAKLPLSAAQGKVLMDLYNVLNTNQQKRLLSEVFIINASTTVGEVSAAVSKGTVLIYHTTATKMPSYGKGIILYSSDENFKALLADDDNHSVYLWSCHKQRPSTKILDVVNVIKIV